MISNIEISGIKYEVDENTKKYVEKVNADIAGVVVNKIQ